MATPRSSPRQLFPTVGVDKREAKALLTEGRHDFCLHYNKEVAVVLQGEAPFPFAARDLHETIIWVQSV